MTEATLPSSPWLRSPLWDGIWLLSGLWLVLLALLLQQTSLEWFYISGTFTLWLAHRFGTTYLAFCSPTYHSLIQKHSFRFILAPLLIGFGVFGFLLLPQTWIPFNRIQRIMLLGFVDYFFSLYHFAVQHYGVVSIYRVRAGQRPDASQKRWEKLYCLGMGGGMVLIAEILHGTSFLAQWHEMPFPQVKEPHTILEGLDADLIYRCLFAGMLWVAVCTAFLGMIELRRGTASLPKLLYILSLGGLGIAAFYLDPFTFLMIWNLQHWLVALGLTSHMAVNGAHLSISQDRHHGSAWYRFWNRINRHRWSTLAVLVLCSIVLTPFFEVDTTSESDRYGHLLFPVILQLLENSTLLIILVGLGFSTGFIHYLMDRSLFRFSHPATRQRSLPLLLSSFSKTK